jgi:thiol-disulfide isomerase/thioredoxin
MSKMVFTLIILVASVCSRAQEQARKLMAGTWRASVDRSDGNSIFFNFDVKDKGARSMLYIRNASEKLIVDDIKLKSDSVLIQLPFFDSEIKAAFSGNKLLTGIWIKHLKDRNQVMNFRATYNELARFTASNGPASVNVTGRWAVTFRGPSGKDSTPAVGEFVQKGNLVTGTFLHPTGDLRYLEGIVTGDSLKLSCFDGGHAYLFTAKIKDNHLIPGGIQFSGPVYKEIWTAERNEQAKLPDEFSLTKLKPGRSHLNFAFKDVDGRKVSITDTRFRNKVIVIQIMGSWCPNCMDETRFLSGFYDRYHDKGFEIIGLAYERSTDFVRSQKNVRNIQKRFAVKYPLLITGVTESDSLLTEKTLPQIEKIEGFPTTIFVNKMGEVAKIQTGFNGPATGEHYDEEQKTFASTVEQLLSQQ